MKKFLIMLMCFVMSVTALAWKKPPNSIYFSVNSVGIACAVIEFTVIEKFAQRGNETNKNDRREDLIYRYNSGNVHIRERVKYLPSSHDSTIWVDKIFVNGIECQMQTEPQRLYRDDRSIIYLYLDKQNNTYQAIIGQ